jgi:hypothetical protein
VEQIIPGQRLFNRIPGSLLFLSGNKGIKLRREIQHLIHKSLIERNLKIISLEYRGGIILSPGLIADRAARVFRDYSASCPLRCRNGVCWRTIKL